MICAVILIAFSTALTGPIAFVSFLSGPIATHVLGRGMESQLQSGLVGTILVLSADIIGQFTFNSRFPICFIVVMLLCAPQNKRQIYLILIMIDLAFIILDDNGISFMMSYNNKIKNINTNRLTE